MCCSMRSICRAKSCVVTACCPPCSCETVVMPTAGVKVLKGEAGFKGVAGKGVKSGLAAKEDIRIPEEGAAVLVSIPELAAVASSGSKFRAIG